jgi:hypothetical protein
VLLHTGRDRATANAIAQNLLPKPSTTARSLRAVREYLDTWAQTGGPDSGSVPGEVLSMLGLTLGSSAKILAGLYVETGLVREQVRAAGGRIWAWAGALCMWRQPVLHRLALVCG